MACGGPCLTSQKNTLGVSCQFYLSMKILPEHGTFAAMDYLKTNAGLLAASLSSSVVATIIALPFSALRANDVLREIDELTDQRKVCILVKAEHLYVLLHNLVKRLIDIRLVVRLLAEGKAIHVYVATHERGFVSHCHRQCLRC
jgi:hypothetical protein